MLGRPISSRGQGLPTPRRILSSRFHQYVVTSPSEAIETATPGGGPVFHLSAALGQLKRDLVRERTRAGLAAAAARGSTRGRWPVITVVKVRRAWELVAKGLGVRDMTVRLKIRKIVFYETLGRPAS